MPEIRKSGLLRRTAGRVKSYVDNNGATLNKGEYCTQSEHVNMIIIINAYGSDKCALPGFVQKCPKRLVLGCVICAPAARHPHNLERGLLVNSVFGCSTPSESSSNFVILTLQDVVYQFVRTVSGL